MSLVSCTFKSSVLQSDTTYLAVIPDKVSENIPVVYLLHGYSGNHSSWVRNTNCERCANERGVALIMPDAANSFYTDMVYGPAYYTFITQEVFEHSHRLFRLSNRREATFVAGLSMGGYGALKIALSNPEKYTAAASFSGALDVIGRMKVGGDWTELGKAIVGDNSGVEKTNANLFYLLKQDINPKPRILQMCGTEDFLYKDNIRFKNEIEKLGYDYEYKEGPGVHSWDFWDECIKYALKFFNIESK